MSVAVICLLAVTVLSASADTGAPHRQVVTLRRYDVPLYSSIAAFDFFGMWALETCDAARLRDETSKGKYAELEMTELQCRERAFSFSLVGCNHPCKNINLLFQEVCEKRRQIVTDEMRDICCPVVYRTGTLEENRAEQRAQAALYPHYFQ